MIRRELLLVGGLALLVRAVAAGRVESLLPDGVIELEQARAFAAGDWGAGLAWGFHPLYSLLVALPVALGAPLEASARALAVLLSAGVAPLCAASAASLLPGPPAPGRARRAALAAGLLAALLPLLVRLGGQVLAYGPAHLALAGALLCAVRAARGGAGPAGAAGAAVGLGYLCRSDALATGAGLGLALLLAPGPARRRGARAGAFALGLLLGLAPYALALRAHTGEWRLSLKKRADVLLRLPAAPAAAQAPDAAAPLELRELVRLEELDGDRARLAPVPGFGAGESAWFAARKLLGAAHPLVAALALLGLLLALRRSPRAALQVPLLALVGGWAGQTLLRANYGYTDRIHAAFAGVLLAPLAGIGLLLGAHALARRAGLPARLPCTLALAVAALVLLPAALEPQRQGRGEEAPLGRELRAWGGPGPLTVCGRDTRVPAWHAGAAYLDIPPGPPQEALEAARAAGARFLVVHLRWYGERPGGLEAALAAAGLPPPRVRESRRDEVRYAWLAWDLTPRAGAPEPSSRR